MSNIFLVGANFGKDVSKDFIKKESGPNFKFKLASL